MSKNLLAAIVAVVFLVLAAIGYDRYVPIHHLDRSRLAELVVTTPPAGFTTKPSASNQVQASSDPFSTVGSIAKKSPSGTGAWAVSWADPASQNDSATILVSLLPNGAGAEQVEVQAVKAAIGRDSTFKTAGYAYESAPAVPGVPGAASSVFTPAAKATTPPEAAVVFRAGRSQVLVLVSQTGTPAAVGTVAAGLARSEYLHVGQVLPGFSLTETHVPLTASVLYWLVAVGIVTLAVAIPLAVRRGWRRREESRRRTARRHHSVRGSKIARRQATRRR